MTRRSGLYPTIIEGDPRWAMWSGTRPAWPIEIERGLFIGLQAAGWPRFRLRVNTDDDKGAPAALERITGRRGGVRVSLETLDSATDQPFPEAREDISKAFGYSDEDLLKRIPLEDEDAAREVLPRLDTRLGEMILEMVRLAAVARTAPTQEERLGAREMLRKAARSLGVRWDGTPAEGEEHVPQATYVDELAWFIKDARAIFRRESFKKGEAAATEQARQEWWPQVRLLFTRWELRGNKVDWQWLQREATWRKMLTRSERKPGESLPRVIAAEWLGRNRERSRFSS